MADPTTIPNVAALADLVGRELGPTDWIEVSQQQIDAFAHATGDRQWIHCDVERAQRESPFESTIAHGYLTVALTPVLLPKLLLIENCETVINAGIERLRLSTPVLSGSRIRMSANIKNARKVPRGGIRATISVRFEVEGSEKPACLGDLTYVYFPAET
ncbi:MAG: MaoC family dehydratase [Deltaproteobacteria bacterium]|nr:MaoC family dehydratase [Deltaproteobacteria bacterium]